MTVPASLPPEQDVRLSLSIKPIANGLIMSASANPSADDPMADRMAAGYSLFVPGPDDLVEGFRIILEAYKERTEMRRAREA